VRFDLVPVEDPVGFPSYAPDQHWAERDLDHAAALLQEVAATPVKARALARPLAQQIRKRYRPAEVASAFRAAVAEQQAGGSVGAGAGGDRVRGRH